MEFPHSPVDADRGVDGADQEPAARARDFARRVVRPSVADRDRDGRWDPDLFAELAAARTGPGFAGPLVPHGL
ncbi:hypothetical protein GT043_19560, partial [Streptomyces sp. SID2131]|nr:hypothetical protein [Streptomyces sp. SID2131]